MDPNQPGDIPALLQALQGKIDQLANGRSVRLIAVSKTQPPTAIRKFLLAGQRDFGENRPNEARAKIPLVPTADLSTARQPIYHHIGPLQSGNARQVAGLFHFVHGVSSWKALEILHKACQTYRSRSDEHYVMRYLIQLDLTHEQSKAGGMDILDLQSFGPLPRDTGFYPCGFMCMGPTSQDQLVTRQVFRECAAIRDSIMPAGELSMGMSNDWQIAIQEGATMIRLGTLLFGSRNSQPWRPAQANQSH
ncbi:MAG: YggS family pyridoxal phosphate-dependent enzyme [Leptospiraceae bacterium]|nr:YggS family pyridoxal phosphate-dependent enzyme [Leptospiraceae bacterium]